MIRYFKNKLIINKFLCPLIESKTNFATNSGTFHRIEHEKLCRSEVMLKFLSGIRCPDPNKLTDTDWQYIFNLPSRHQRIRHYQYLYNRHNDKNQNEMMRAIRKEIIEFKHEKMIEDKKKTDHIVYGLGENTLFIRFNRQRFGKWMNLRLLRSKLFGQKLLIDCTFDEQMSDREIRTVSWKLENAYSQNRIHARPFDFHLFGSKSKNVSIDRFVERNSKLTESTSATEIHYECYTKLYPKERLVLLTPNTDVDLKYNFNDIYVVGGIVDKGRNEPLMLQKAKRFGLRTARLPVHLINAGFNGNTELPFDNVIDILRERQMTDDWKKIFKQFSEVKDIKYSRKERKHYRSLSN